MNDTEQAKQEPTEAQWKELERDITALLKLLKPTIGGDYRATDDPDDNIPGMCVTVGATFKDGAFRWHYQTGDNSFTGGAYGHAHWGVGYLYRRSKSAEVAEQIVNKLSDAMLL